MKFALTSLFLLWLCVASAFGQSTSTNRTPLHNAYLQNGMNGNSQTISNATVVEAGTNVVLTVDSATGVQVVNTTGGGGGGSFTGDSTQFTTDGGGTTHFKTAALQTNFNGQGLGTNNGNFTINGPANTGIARLSLIGLGTGGQTADIYSTANDLQLDIGGTDWMFNNAGGITFDNTHLTSDGSGNVTGVSFTGAGSGLTSLNASSLSSGTVGTARLGSGSATANTLLHGNNSWSAVSLTADVTGLLPAANQSSNSIYVGTNSNAGLTNSGLVTLSNPANIIDGNGGGLTNLNAIASSNGVGYYTTFYGSNTAPALTIAPTNIYTISSGLSGTIGGNLFTLSTGTTAGWINGFSIVGANGDQYRVDEIVDSTHFYVFQRITQTYNNHAYTVYPVAVTTDNILGTAAGDQVGAIENDGSFSVNTEYGNLANSGAWFWNGGTNTIAATLAGNLYANAAWALETCSGAGNSFVNYPFTVDTKALNHALDIEPNSFVSFGYGVTNNQNAPIPVYVGATFYSNVTMQQSLSITSNLTTGTLTLPVLAKTGNYTWGANDTIVQVTNGGVLTLPDLTTVKGKVLIAVNLGGGTLIITNFNGSQKFNYAGYLAVSNNLFCASIFHSDGTNYITDSPLYTSSFYQGGGGGSGTVTSVTFTGDGTVESSTPSSAVTTSGTVTATLANAAAYSVLNNNTSSSAAPVYTASPIVTNLTVTNTYGSSFEAELGTNAFLVVSNGTTVANADTNGNIYAKSVTATSGPFTGNGVGVTNIPAAGLQFGTIAGQSSTNYTVTCGQIYNRYLGLATNICFTNFSGGPGPYTAIIHPNGTNIVVTFPTNINFPTFLINSTVATSGTNTQFTVTNGFDCTLTFLFEQAVTTTPTSWSNINATAVINN